MHRSKLFVVVMLTAAILQMEAIAQSDSPVNRSTGVIQQLQWSAVDVDATQFKGVRNMAVNALGMRPVVDQPDFAVLVAMNGSLFEIYGPGDADLSVASWPRWCSGRLLDRRHRHESESHSKIERCPA